MIAKYASLADELAAVADAAWESDEAKGNRQRAVDDVIEVLRARAAAGHRSIEHEPTLYPFVRLSHVTSGLREHGFRVSEGSPVQWYQQRAAAGLGVDLGATGRRVLKIEW